MADPGDALGLLAPLPAGAGRVENARDADVVVLFVTARRELEASIDELAAAIHERLHETGQGDQPLVRGPGLVADGKVSA